MNTTSKLIIFIWTFLSLAANAHAQSPREQVQQLIAQLQKTPYDKALREKIVKLTVGIKPALAIPEEARRSFIIGEAVFKQAKTLRPAFEAANAFRTASTLAPWWGEAYWNLAIAQRFIGQYVGAKESLRFYLLTNPRATDRRMAQDRIYAIEADIIATTSIVPGGLAGFWQRSSYQSQTNGEWIKDDPEGVRNGTYEIQQTGSSHGIKCITCYSDSYERWTVNVVSSSSNAITFQKQYTSRSSDGGPENHSCKLEGNTLNCSISRKGEKNFNVTYAKRNVCEVVGGPGIQGYLVLCK